MTKEEIEAIIKPIFTKMFNSNFSACEYGIECYKKGMEYQGIKELATENDNLIQRIAKLESQIDKMKSDVTRNIKWADQNKNEQMYCKLNAMINQCKIKEND